MAVEVIGNTKQAVFTCTTSEWAFGLVMPGTDYAERFLAWLASEHGVDPREIANDDEACWAGLRQEFEQAHGWDGENRCFREPEGDSDS